MSTARIWSCPECGHTEDIGYDWLAEHGGPVCQQCDEDMVLLPEVGTTADDRTDARRWVLYDLDTDTLLSTATYDSYEAAAEQASQVNDVLILPLVCNGIRA